MVEPPKVDVVGFLDWFYKTYGSNWTLILVFSIPIAIVGWQIFQALRKDKEANLALAAKEDTIQRLAQENRLYRIQTFKEQFKWTDHQIEHWLLANEAPTPAQPPAVKAKKK